MRLAWLWVAGAMAAWPAIACPALSDGSLWRVRSVRPRTPSTERLAGAVLRRDDLEAARRSFDAAPGARLSISVTIAYLEHCEEGEADLVFRSFRLRIPYGFGLTPALDLARAWTSGVVSGHRDWAHGRLAVSYAAGAGSQGLRHTATIEVLGDRAEARIAAGNDIVSARFLAVGPAVWTRPLLPAALRNHPDFHDQIQAALATAESMLRVERYAQDPSFKIVARELARMDAAECLPAAFRRRLESLRTATGGRQYGLVDSLLAIDAPPGCAAAAALLPLQEQFARIDRQSAAARAAEDMAQLRDLADRLLYRMPLVAVRPVAVVESIRSGARTALPAVGAGIRVSFFGWLDATAGYSWRIRRAPGVQPGTPFIEMRFRDPLR